METATQIVIAVVVALPALLAAILTIVRIIVRITPSTKDDLFLAKNESKIAKVLDASTKLATIVKDVKK